MNFEETMASRSDRWFKFVIDQEGLDTKKKRANAWKEAQNLVNQNDKDDGNIFALLDVLLAKEAFSRSLYGPGDFALTFESVFEDARFIEKLESFVWDSMRVLKL